MVQDIPQQIRSLDGLTDILIVIIEEDFKIAIVMKLKWGRWTIIKGKKKEEIVEGNMIFAIRL